MCIQLKDLEKSLSKKFERLRIFNAKGLKDGVEKGSSNSTDLVNKFFWVLELAIPDCRSKNEFFSFKLKLELSFNESSHKSSTFQK